MASQKNDLSSLAQKTEPFKQGDPPIEKPEKNQKNIPNFNYFTYKSGNFTHRRPGEKGKEMTEDENQISKMAELEINFYFEKPVKSIKATDI